MKDLMSHTSSIVFCAAAAALCVLFAVVFIVAVAKKKHVRSGSDVVKLLLGSVVFVVAFVLGVFAVVNKYAVAGVSAAREGSKLAFLYNGKNLFAVPAIGFGVTLFVRLKLVGIIAPFAVCLLSLIAMIAVSAKSYRNKKKKAQVADVSENAFASEPVSTGSGADAPDADSSAPDEQLSAQPLYEENILAPEQEYDVKDDESEDLPPTDIAPDAARDIVDEIDALVTGEHGEFEESGIDDKLRRAIQEGFALTDEFDAFAGQSESSKLHAEPEYEESSAEEEIADSDKEENVGFTAEEEPAEVEEEPAAEQEDGDYTGEDLADEEDNERVSDSEGEEQAGDTEYEEEDNEPSYEESAFAQAGDDYESDVYESSEEVSAPSAQPVITKPENTDRGNTGLRATKADTIVRGESVGPAPVYPHADGHLPTRVRTIVRRPTAKNIDELSRRAAEEEPAPIAEEKPKPPAKSAGGKKQAPRKKKESSGAAQKTQSGSSAAKPDEKPKTEAASKTVVAEERNLPLSRKYIILNRRNAAAVFNEYLNTKREQEKKEITDTLNTIIIK